MYSCSFLVDCAQLSSAATDRKLKLAQSAGSCLGSADRLLCWADHAADAILRIARIVREVERMDRIVLPVESKADGHELGAGHVVCGIGSWV